MEKKRQKSNFGYSLIELVVTILISSMIMASAALFFSLGLNKYKTIDAEEILQTESQSAEYFLTETFQEATDFQKVTTLPSGMTSAYQVRIRDNVTNNDTFLFLVLQNNVLYVGSSDAVGPTFDANNDIKEFAAGGSKALTKASNYLASYVTEFSVDYNSYTEAMDRITNPIPGVIRLTLKYNVMGREYVSTTFVTIRNRKMN